MIAPARRREGGGGRPPPAQPLPLSQPPTARPAPKSLTAQKPVHCPDLLPVTVFGKMMSLVAEKLPLQFRLPLMMFDSTCTVPLLLSVTAPLMLFDSSSTLPRPGHSSPREGSTT